MATGTIGRDAENSPSSSSSCDAAKLTFNELRSALRRVGEERYHHKHPFHLLMHEGKLSRGQLQAWALNRYYYRARLIRRVPASGANASSITMETSRGMAGSCAGSSWRKRRDWIAIA